ncbi:MAG: dual specificity protein phosphatase family protein [Methylobacteriaceae bacterium]|nr:dual specificity protein phosphatase family protein [Methylobacteriaceae bacterium]
MAIMARPRAGEWLDDEMSGWRAEGIDAVVSLLQAEEVRDLGLECEADICRRAGMEFISFPIPDRGVPPSMAEAAALANGIVERLRAGQAVAVHCRAGIGRASLVAACTLVVSGSDSASAFDLIARVRGVDVPDTQEQRDWVAAFGKASADLRSTIGPPE